MSHVCLSLCVSDVSGLHWSSYPEGVSGLEVRMDGFNDKLHVLAHRVFKALATAQVRCPGGGGAELCRRAGHWAV